MVAASLGNIIIRFFDLILPHCDSDIVRGSILDGQEESLTNIGHALLFSIRVLLYGSSRSEAQQPPRTPRVGILIPKPLDESRTVKGFKDGLKKAGYNESENIIFEVQDLKGARDQLQRGIDELVSHLAAAILVVKGRAFFKG
jgi:hypothetical protein